jgi:hypothetical protein
MKNVAFIVIGVIIFLTSCGITKPTLVDDTSDITPTSVEVSFIVDTIKWSLTEENDSKSVDTLPLESVDLFDKNVGVLYYKRKYRVTNINNKNTIFEASTRFEGDPDQIVYLDSTQTKFEYDPTNNTFFMTVLLSWGPIAPITIKVYKDNNLLTHRDFKLKFY